MTTPARSIDDHGATAAMFTSIHPQDHTPACVGENPELWFADQKHPRETAKAKSICNRCPVRLSCLQTALTDRIEYGIWGGSTPEQRERWVDKSELTDVVCAIAECTGLVPVMSANGKNRIYCTRECARKATYRAYKIRKLATT